MTLLCNILTESVGYEFADGQFSELVEFMSGVKPEECSTDELSNAPGKRKMP